MGNYYTDLGIISLFFALGTLLLGLLSFRRPFNRLYAIFISLVVAVFFWYLGSGMQLLSTQIGVKVFWNQVAYLGVATTTPLWFLFILSFLRYDQYLKAPHIIIFLSFPFFIVSFAFTNDFHGLIWPVITPVSGNLLLYEHGPLFYLNIFYSYFLIGTGTLILGQRLKDSPKDKKLKICILILSGLIPFVFNLLYNFQILPNNLDITPLGLSISVFLIFWGVFLFNLLDLDKIAYKQFLKSSKSGVLIFDSQDRLIEFNPATSLIGIGPEDLGKHIDDVFKDLPPIQAFIEDPHGKGEVYLEKDDLWLKLKLDHIYDQGQAPVGRLFKFLDISSIKRTEDALRISEDKSKAIMDAIPDMMFIVDEKGGIVDFKVPLACSKELSFLKMKKNDLENLGLSLDIKQIMSRIRQTLKEGSPQKFEVSLTLNGNINYYELRLIKLNTTEVLILARDISEIREIQKSLQESESLYRSIFYNSGVPMAIFNSEGFFLWLIRV